MCPCHFTGRDDEHSGTMRMEMAPVPEGIQWPQHSFSVSIESFLARPGGVKKWKLHFIMPGLAVWMFPMPWVCFHLCTLRAFARLQQNVEGSKTALLTARPMAASIRLDNTLTLCDLGRRCADSWSVVD